MTAPSVSFKSRPRNRTRFETLSLRRDAACWRKVLGTTGAPALPWLSGSGLYSARPRELLNQRNALHSSLDYRSTEAFGLPTADETPRVATQRETRELPQVSPMVPPRTWAQLGGNVHRVAIIGAGASGIVAAKTLLQAGVDVTLYERGSYLGGLWKYDNDNGASVAYKNLTILTPKRYTEWRDFPFDADTPEYAHHKDMLRYLQQYADFFEVTPRIRFNNRVVSVRPTPTAWEVTSEAEGVTEFDAVVATTGHFHTPRLPTLPGPFDGSIMHSAEYRDLAQAANKRVLIIGMGNSAMDIAVDVSWVAQKTVISARSPIFNGPRWLFGHSFLDILRRFQGPHVPVFLGDRVARRLVRIYWGDLHNWGFRESRKGAHGALNEFLLPIMRSGRIKLRPDLTAVTGNNVTFSDGTQEGFDLIIAATGYRYSFPYLDGLVDMLNDSAEVDNIYLRIFSVDHPGLAFVGLSNNNGVSNTPWFERQAELVADVFTGRVALPSPDEMRVAVRQRREKTKALFVNTPRHAMEERHPDYSMEIQRERQKRRIRIGTPPAPIIPLSTSDRCWLCGTVIETGQARILHATDWASLRWWSNIYTKPVKLCLACYRKNRRADVLVTTVAFLVCVIALAIVVGVVVGAVFLVSHLF